MDRVEAVSEAFHDASEKLLLGVKLLFLVVGCLLAALLLTVIDRLASMSVLLQVLLLASILFVGALLLLRDNEQVHDISLLLLERARGVMETLTAAFRPSKPAAKAPVADAAPVAAKQPAPLFSVSGLATAVSRNVLSPPDFARTGFGVGKNRRLVIGGAQVAALADAPLVAGIPVAARHFTTLLVFYRSDQGHIIQCSKSLTSTTWRWIDLTDVLGLDNAIAACDPICCNAHKWPAGSLHLFFVVAAAEGGHIHELVLRVSRWRHSILTAGKPKKCLAAKQNPRLGFDRGAWLSVTYRNIHDQPCRLQRGVTGLRGWRFVPLT